jgi:hypothetical protein
MAGEAALVYRIGSRGFCFEIEDQFLGLGVFRFGALRFHFCIGVRLARAMTPFTAGGMHRFSYLGGAT